MADVLALGGKVGNPVKISAVPDSTFATEIAALISAGTYVVGKLVGLTWSANYQVTSPAEDAIPDGRIVGYEKTTSASGNSYILDVELFHYADQNGNGHTPVCIQEIDYDGSLALQDSVICYDTAYRAVDDGGTGGWGAVIALDTTNSKAHVLF